MKGWELQALLSQSNVTLARQPLWMFTDAQRQHWNAAAQTLMSPHEQTDLLCLGEVTEETLWEVRLQFFFDKAVSVSWDEHWIEQKKHLKPAFRFWCQFEGSLFELLPFLRNFSQRIFKSKTSLETHLVKSCSSVTRSDLEYVDILLCDVRVAPLFYRVMFCSADGHFFLHNCKKTIRMTSSVNGQFKWKKCCVVNRSHCCCVTCVIKKNNKPSHLDWCRAESKRQPSGPGPSRRMWCVCWHHVESLKDWERRQEI